MPPVRCVPNDPISLFHQATRPRTCFMHYRQQTAKLPCLTSAHVRKYTLCQATHADTQYQQLRQHPDTATAQSSTQEAKYSLSPAHTHKRCLSSGNTRKRLAFENADAPVKPATVGSRHGTNEHATVSRTSCLTGSACCRESQANSGMQLYQTYLQHVTCCIWAITVKSLC